MLVRLVVFMAFLLCGLITTAQQAAIIVLDSKTKNPVPFANVCLEGLYTGKQLHGITDIKGLVHNECREKSKIAISYIGYETLHDTISPGINETVYLQPAVLNINEVVVTAQFAPERSDKSIYKVNVLSSKQIELKSATNLSDLLATESNIKVSQGGVLGSSISMQGLSGENIKFLIDGVPVIGRVNGNIDLNQLNLYNVDHIEIIEGPMSVIYGSNAIAGVINIITKENKNSQLSAFINAYTETLGEYNFNMGLSKRFKQHLFSIDGSRNFFAGLATYDTLRSMQWKPRMQYNADASYLYNNSRLRLKLNAEYFNETILDKGALIPPYYETAFDNTYQTVRTSGVFNGSYKIRGDQLLMALASYSSYNRVHNNHFKDLTTLHQNLVDRDTTSYESWMFRSWINQNNSDRKFNYQTGIDLNYDAGEGDRVGGVVRKIGEYAGFLSGRYDPVNYLSFQPGLRLVYNTKYSAPLIYSFNLRWGMTKNTTFRTSYAKGFRSPSFKELYMSFYDINHNVNGNPDLQAEYADYIGLNAVYGRETTQDYINCELSYSYYDVSNKIQLVMLNNGSSPPIYGYINVSRLKTQSVSLSTAWSFYPSVTLKAGINTVGRHIPGNAGFPEYDKYVWNTDVSTSLSYKTSSNLTYSLFYKRSGKYLRINDDAYIDGSYISSYQFVDVSLSKGLVNNRLVLTAGCKNLLDVRDVFSSGSGGSHGGGGGTDPSSTSIARGRSYFIRLSFNFNKYE